MATVTPPTAPRNLAQSHTRVRSPLARLRNYIRAYVSLEGAAFFLLYLALWFWIGMVLDYGFFKAFTVDWVQVLPWWMRGGVLVVLVAGLLAALATKIVMRLVREFNDVAVALVLERRFPKLLGDRLITAVELSDPKKAEEYGYSGAMVEQTIHEAAERVDQVPLGAVFSWRRLIRGGLLVLLLTLGLYLLVGGTVTAVRAVGKKEPAAAGFGQFHDVSSIWFERNILLRNTIWPRDAHLEVLEPAADLRVAKRETPPPVRVRAWKYVVADRRAPQGWRLLRWDEAGDVPEAPADWAPRDPEVGLTVDEVELRLGKFDVRGEGEDRPAKWNLADSGGARKLQWSDLRPEHLGGRPVPRVPGEWDPKGWHSYGLSLMGLGAGVDGPLPLGLLARARLGPAYVGLDADEVQARLAAAQEQKAPAGVSVPDLRHAFERLTRLVELREALDRVDARASDPSMSRTLRKLTVPPTLKLTARSAGGGKSEVTLQRAADNEYTGSLGALEETVTYTVRGEDYETEKRTVVVVDHPQLESLVSVEERPAYLHYWPWGDEGPAALRGKRQLFEEVSINVGGSESTIDVPAGTSLKLTGKVTKPIEDVRLQWTDKEGKAREARPERLGDGHSFQFSAPDVRERVVYTVVFTDKDGVTGRRVLKVNPRPDEAPRVREFAPDEAVRKKEGQYLITARARLPFRGKLNDDNGLAGVRYFYTAVRRDFVLAQKLRGLNAVGGVPLALAPGGSTRLAAAAVFLKVAQDREKVESEGTQVQRRPLGSFAAELARGRTLADGRPQLLKKESVLQLLNKPQKHPFRKLLADFSIEADDWTQHDEDADNPRRWVQPETSPFKPASDLPVYLLNYFDRADGKSKPVLATTGAQPSFLIEVGVEVEDTYAEGPLVGAGKKKVPQPHVRASETFVFQIISERELLGYIAEDEEQHYTTLQTKAFEPLPPQRERLQQMGFELQTSTIDPKGLSALIAKTADVLEALDNSERETKGVAAAYDKIMREMRLNRLGVEEPGGEEGGAMTQSKVYGVAKPLRDLEGQYTRTRAKVQELRATLESKDGRMSVAERLKKAQDLNGEAKVLLNRLIKDLNDILSNMQGLAKLRSIVIELGEQDRALREQSEVITAVRDALLLDLLGEGAKKP